VENSGAFVSIGGEQFGPLELEGRGEEAAGDECNGLQGDRSNILKGAQLLLPRNVVEALEHSCLQFLRIAQVPVVSHDLVLLRPGPNIVLRRNHSGHKGLVAKKLGVNQKKKKECSGNKQTLEPSAERISISETKGETE